MHDKMNILFYFLFFLNFIDSSIDNVIFLDLNLKSLT